MDYRKDKPLKLGELQEGKAFQLTGVPKYEKKPWIFTPPPMDPLKVIQAYRKDTQSDILTRAGIKVVREDGKVYWVYNERKVLRPKHDQFESTIEFYFKIKIKYT